MEDLNVVIAGAAGEGIQTVGEILAKVVSAQGYGVFSWKEYESRIRGGQNSYRIRISPEPRNAPLSEADILLALNEGAVNKYEGLLNEGGTLLAAEPYRKDMIVIDFVTIAQEVAGSKIYSNTAALGALMAVLGVELKALNQVMAKAFADKSEDILENNYRVAKKGFDSANRECRDMCPWELPSLEGRCHLISVNEAIPLAAAYSGCRFMSAYPMTPSTGIITFLAKEQERLGVFIEQAEDEIAAINMAIGAGYAGVRSMTATSGGGFALMAEGISLAGMTETPLVIVLAQRPGPATGLPTRTAQGDLLFAVNAGHGEFPKMVLAPSDPEEAFYQTVRAFNLADKYQMPVIIMTDQFLADAHFSLRAFDLDRIAPQIYLADPSLQKPYKRYALTENGISPRLFPGQSEHLVCADSDEHDETGHITEDLMNTARAMAEKRMTKLKGLKTEIGRPEEINLEQAETVFIGWGSSRGAILEAMDRLERKNHSTGLIHFSELWPLPAYRFSEDKNYWIVENTISGQLARLLRSEYDLNIKGILGRYDGLPLTGNFIRRTYHDQYGNV